MGPLPNVLVVGFPRCGTTALLHNLGKHPEVHAHPHEVGFFRRPDTPEAEYRALFRADRRYNVEKHPYYALEEAAARRIAERLPGARLFVCVRHPIQMLHSFYNFRAFEFRRGLRAAFDPQLHRFEELVLEGRELDGVSVERGCYAAAIRGNLLARFAREQIHFVVQERMWADTRREMDAAFRFLELAPCAAEWERAHRHDGAYGYKRFRKHTPRYRAALAELLRRYEASNRELASLLGDDLPEWRATTARYQALLAGPPA